MSERTRLVVTRRIGESVEIGDRITVTIAGILAHRVRLAIEVPQEIKITRSELGSGEGAS